LGSQTAEIHETKMWSNIFENFFTINKNFFEDFKFEMVAGFSAQWENYQSITVSGTGFPSDNLINSSIQAAKSVSVPITEKSRTTLASFFGRINLGLYHKYHLSLSTRYDGSSVFSENDKWATFPAIGFAWRINEEDFINNTNISNLKLRTSWGLSGNQAITPYQSIYVGNVVNTGQGAGSGINVGIAPTLPNKNLTWETTEQYNLGLDFGILKDRIYFVFDYYEKNTKDLLANVALPGSSGFSYYVDNVGAVQNKGIELTFGTDIIRNENTSLSIDLNYSQNRNEVKETKNNLDIIPSSTDDATRTQEIVRVGEPIFSFYMPKFLGLDNTGAPQYEDLNNDGVIDNEDNQIVGSPFPDFFYGADISMSYKQISLKMSWQGVNGAKLNNALLHSLTTPEPITNRVKNIKEYYPYLSDEYVVWDSDRFIEDASFLRLKNIKLTYTFSDVFKIINELHVYASAQNILTITNYSGYDPEVNSFSNKNQLQGVDYGAFPYAKSIMVGLNIVF
jgi:TonB-linked SusC/RagA family outer membrane protein